MNIEQDKLTLNDYQRLASGTAIYKGGLTYCLLGLTNEAGEAAGVLKKIYRQDSKWTVHSKRKLQAELGDVLWYLAMCAKEMNLSLEDIAIANLDKLESRQQRGVIKGDGDER